MKELAQCPVCQSEQFSELLKRTVVYPGSDLHSNLLDINYVRNYILFEKLLHSKESIEFCFKLCTNCGLVFFSPRPEETDMTIKYQFTGELGDVEVREKSRYKESYHGLRALKIHKFTSGFRAMQGLNIVDIGGGHGLNLKYFLDGNQCYVVDQVKQELIDKEIQYLCQTVKDVPPSMHFDLALFCHTLEHIVDPAKELLEIKNILQPNGLLYIEVPFGCWREYRQTRNFLTHINFFSEGSLYHLLDMCGLHIKYLKLKPTLMPATYDLVIVALAENVPIVNKMIEAYQITQKQMKGKHYGLRVYELLLNVRLGRLRLFRALVNRYINKFRW